MRRVIIICEGPTEIEFCKDVLYPHFLPRNIYIQTPLIKKSGGGIVAWVHLKRQIENHLKQDPTAFVTKLIDYYGIHAHYAFPRWQEANGIVNKSERMELLEIGMKEAIDDRLRNRFVPYVQLHEFEGLLFNTMAVFDTQIPPEEFVDRNELDNIINTYTNPELINDTPTNAPSKRLMRLITGYNKIVYGAILAKEIGLERIRNKSPRFNEWITKLEALAPV